MQATIYHDTEFVLNCFRQINPMKLLSAGAVTNLARGNQCCCCIVADLLANGGRHRPVGDRPVTGNASFLPSPNGFDVLPGQSAAGMVPRGVTPVPGGSGLQRGLSSPLASDVSVIEIEFFCMKS